MSAPCPELHELLELESRAADDERRRHLDDCPRCRNRVALYASFVEPVIVPAGADVADAERRLAEAFERAWRAESPDPVAPRETGPARGAGDSAARRGWWAPSWRPAWALAAVLLVGSIVLLRPWDRGPPETGALRGAPGGAGQDALRLEVPVRLDGGGLRLSWAAHPEADAYEVRILGPDLAELMRREVTGASLELGRDELPATPAGAVLGWKVTALRAGARLATSTTGTLRRP